MAGTRRRLKDEYKRSLWIFIAVNIAIFWGVWVAGVFYGKETKEFLSSLLSPKAFFLPLVPILTTALSGLLPQTAKEIIVFFRIRNRLPGCRAFSVWAKRDPRIDPAVLEKKYGALPNEPFQENRLWFTLYKSHEDECVVLASHREFLMLRDFSAVAIIFLLFGGVSIWFAPCSHYIKALYLFALVAQSFILQLSARNHGVRFVTNVLAAETEFLRTGKRQV